MRPTFRRLLGALAAAWLAAGCATTGLPTDAADIRVPSPVEAQPALPDEGTESERAEDARRLLAAPLDADTAVRVALLENRELRAALRELGIPRGHLAQTGSLPNPVVEVERLPEPTHPLELRVEYDVTHALLAPLRAHAAEPELAAAGHRVAAEVVALGHRVRVAVHRVQAAEQRVALARQMREGLAAGREAAEAMFAAGNVPELDLVRRTTAHERAEIVVRALEMEASAERERLQPLLGTTAAETPWQVRGELPPPSGDVPPAADLEARAQRANLALAEMRARLEGLSRRVDVSRAEGWIPELALSVSALRESADHGAEDAVWGFGGGVSVGLPLFDRRAGATDALEAELSGLRERYQGHTLRLRAATREAHARLLSAQGRERQLRETLLPAQRRLLEQTLLHYNAMQIGIYELLDARRQLLDVELAHVGTLEEYWNARAGLDAILAGHLVSMAATEQPSSLGGETSNEGGH